MSYTPGPWSIEYETNIRGHDGRYVANTGGYSDNRVRDWGRGENTANAVLIAAAPDLLKAAAHVAWLDNKVATMSDTVSAPDWDAAIDALVDAIDKAVGES